jgi:hypothetical protein
MHAKMTQLHAKMTQLTDENGVALPRYERAVEVADPAPAAGPPSGVIPYGDLDDALAGSGLSEGGAQLLRALLRTGGPAVFPGGGVGIDYGSLLKTVTRPDLLAAHLGEAADHLRDRQVDVLVVPGLSGHPIGALYSATSGVPALLLTKQPVAAVAAGGASSGPFPAGSFVLPSYTGRGDVVMSPDPAALQDIVDGVLARQVAAQVGADRLELTLRVAGADDIIDKAAMGRAVGESALVLGRQAIARFVERHRAATGDPRPSHDDVRLVAWATPLVKAYNRPREQLRARFGITPFAGLTVTAVHLDPPALGIEGLGVVAFAEPAGGPAGRP